MTRILIALAAISFVVAGEQPAPAGGGETLVIEMPKKVEDPNEYVRVTVSGGMPGQLSGDIFNTVNGGQLYKPDGLGIGYLPRWLAKYPKSAAAKDALTPEQLQIVGAIDAEAAIWAPLSKKYAALQAAVQSAQDNLAEEHKRQQAAYREAMKNGDKTYMQSARNDARQTRLKGLARSIEIARAKVTEFNQSEDYATMDHSEKRLVVLWSKLIKETPPPKDANPRQ